MILDRLKSGFNDRVFERRFLTVLGIAAVIRVFLFNAAFPPFNPVDELQHFDTIVKYAEGEAYRPRVDPRIDLWSAKLLMFYGSPEYMNPTAADELPLNPNIVRQEEERIGGVVQGIANSTLNHEIHSPPLYYAIAARWLDLGDMLRLPDRMLIFRVRFLNVIAYGALFWLGCLFCRDLFPDNPPLRIGIPMLLCVFPNDVFYSITSDSFSAPFCLLALYMLHQLSLRRKSVLYHLAAGLAVSCTILVKLTNIPVFIVACGFIAFLTGRAVIGRDSRSALRLAVVALAAAAPVAAWMGWNHLVLGDLTGTADKIQMLGWTRKPLAAWFDHPIFRADGFGAVTGNLALLIKTFWRGELVVWHGVHVESAAADFIYTSTSLVFMAAGVAKLWADCRNDPAGVSWVRLSIPPLLVMYLLFLTISSIQFDFGNCATPSRANPFFNKGRLIVGGLIPFLILYLDGLCFLLKTIRSKIDPLLVIFVLCLLISALSLPAASFAFSSRWNWFHLL